MATEPEKVLMERRFHGTREEMRQMREALRTVLAANGADTEQQQRVVLAVCEACMNIVQHGYDGRPGPIGLTLRRRDDHLEVELVDEAPTLSPLDLIPRQREALRPGGLGLHLIRSIMERVELEAAGAEGGNRLRMVTQLEHGAKGK